MRRDRQRTMKFLENSQNLSILSRILSPGMLAICEGGLGTKIILSLDADELFLLDRYQLARKEKYSDMTVKIHEGRLQGISINAKYRNPFLSEKNEK